MKSSHLLILLLLLSASNALAGPPAYTRRPDLAGSRYGNSAGRTQRSGYLDNNEGAYCTADMRKLVNGQLAKLTVIPPARKEWRSGAEYGDYLQNYFAGACAAYTNEINFSGLGEPCGNYRHYYSDYGDGIDQGEDALATAEKIQNAKLPRDYCTGGANAAEQARSSFLQALKTAAPDPQFYKRPEARAYIRGFVQGVCAAFAKQKCSGHLEKAATRNFSENVKMLATPTACQAK